MEIENIKDILFQYGIDEPISVKEIGIENLQSTYKVITSSKEYFLKVSQKQFTNPIAITSRYHVIENLLNKGVYTPRIIKDIKGNNYLICDDFCIELFEWIDLSYYSGDMFFKCVDDLCNVFMAYDNIDFIPSITPRMLSLYKQSLLNDCENPSFKFIGKNDKIYLGNNNTLIASSLLFLKENFRRLKEEIISMPIKYIHADLNKTNISYSNVCIYILDFDTTRLGLRIEDISFIFYDICIDENSNSNMGNRIDYFINKVQSIYPNINIDIILFFLIRRILSILDSQVQWITQGKKSLIINGLKTISESLI